MQTHSLVAGTSVQLLAELAEGRRPAFDPTGETWRHLYGLSTELEAPWTARRLISYVEGMGPLEFRLILFGHDAWSWRNIVGGSTIEAAARGDHDASQKLLEDERYYGGRAAEALGQLVGLDPGQTKELFLGEMKAHLAGMDPSTESEIDAIGRQLAESAHKHGWPEAIERACSYRYLPEPEARRVIAMPHLAGQKLTLAQHDDARLIVFGTSPEPPAPTRTMKLARALSDPTRMKLVAAMKDGPCRLADLVEATAVERSTVHHHLKVLREAGLVSIEGNARSYRYSLDPEGTEQAIEALGSVLTPTKESTE